MARNRHALRDSVIGTGYLGLTHAVCMADLGHQVLAIDVDASKIAKAARGEAPFFEPGLEPLLRKNLESGRLRFTGSFADVGEFADRGSEQALEDRIRRTLAHREPDEHARGVGFGGSAHQ